LTPFVLLGILAVMALGGYNYVQIGRMTNELAEIRANARREPASTGDQKDLLAALESARKHSERARVLIEQGKARTAQRELDQGLLKLKRAATLSKKAATEGGDSFDSTLATFKHSVESLMGEISKQLDKDKSGGNRPPGGE
jgi:hypothetical protein